MSVRAYGGLRVRLYPGDGSASNMRYFTQLYEYDEMRFMQRYLRPGDGFLDGGSNIGTYSLLARSRVGEQGRVDAFEPSPHFATRIRESIEINRLENVHVHELVVAEGSRMADFRVDLSVGNRELAVGEYGETVEVRCVALDNYPDDSPSYAVGKLDLEGNELLALRGAESRLARRDPPVWLIEAADHQLQRYGHIREEVFDLLEQNGYEVARYDGDLNQLFIGRSEARQVDNFIAIASEYRPTVCQRIVETRPL